MDGGNRRGRSMSLERIHPRRKERARTLITHVMKPYQRSSAMEQQAQGRQQVYSTLEGQDVGVLQQAERKKKQGKK